MRGSVVKKGDRYYVKIELDADPLTGRRRQKWHSGYRTKREAEKARIDLLSKFDRGEYVEPTQQTLGEYLTEWLAAIEHTVRPSTFDSYSRNVRNHVIDHIGTTKLAKVDAITLNGLYSLLLASGRRSPSRTGRGYSPAVVERALELRADGLTLVDTAEQLRIEFDEASHITKDTLASLLRRQSERRTIGDLPEGLDRRTVNYVHTILHRALKDAVRWGRLARNPADAANPPRAEQKSDGVHAWDAETLRTFLAKSRESDDRLHALWVCWRPPACAAARRSASAGRTSTSTRVGCEWSRRSRRSAARDRRAEDSARSPLDRPRRRHRRRAARSPQDDARRADARRPRLLRRGPRVSRTRRQPLASRRRERPVRPPRPSARPTAAHPPRPSPPWATLALEQGIHPRVVHERLGHSTIAITLGVYSHVTPGLHDEAANQVASLFL